MNFRFEGGASVHYHILSAESRKYFRNAIPMSGAIANPWALQPKKDYLKSAFKIAEQLGKPQKSYDELVTFLKTIPADSFNRFCTLVSDDPVKIGLSLGPVVESMILIELIIFYE